MLNYRVTAGLPVLALVLMTLGAAMPAAAGDTDACDPTVAADQRIRGCNALIQSGDLGGNDLADAYIARGDAYAEISEHARALADFDEAIRLGEEQVKANDDGEARRALANAYYKRGGFHVWRKADFSRGIADLDQAIRLDPDLIAAYKARGWAHQASGDYERANVDYEEASRRYVEDCPLSMKALHPS